MVEQGQKLCFSHSGVLCSSAYGGKKTKEGMSAKEPWRWQGCDGEQHLSAEANWGQFLSMAAGWKCKPVLPGLLSFQDIIEIHTSMWDGPAFRWLSNPFYNQVLLVGHIVLGRPWVYHSCPGFSLLRRLVVRLIRMYQGNIFIPSLHWFYFIHLSVL